MEFEKIRMVFSKGNIITTPKGLSAVYTSRESWVVQNITENAFEVLKEMIRVSDGFTFDTSGNLICFTFHGYFATENMVLYPAVENQMSIEEMKNMVSAFSNPDKEREFADFFIGVDINDPDASLSRLLEWYNEKIKVNTLDFSAFKRWKDMIRFFRVLKSQGFFADAEISEPEDGFNGCISIHITPEIQDNRVFRGKSKDDLLNLINASGAFDFECLVSEGFLNLDFYS